MYDFEAEYRRIFETPLEEIKEDNFFRADNFQNEKWYGDLQMYLAIGVCKPDRESVSDLQKALKVMGCPSAYRVSNARLDLPLPDTPVTTVNLLRGTFTSTFFRLFTRAPFTSIYFCVDLLLRILK